MATLFAPIQTGTSGLRAWIAAMVGKSRLKKFPKISPLSFLSQFQSIQEYQISVPLLSMRIRSMKENRDKGGQESYIFNTYVAWRNISQAAVLNPGEHYSSQNYQCYRTPILLCICPPCKQTHSQKYKSQDAQIDIANVKIESVSIS